VSLALGLYFATSTLSTGGLRGIPETSDDAVFMMVGLYAALGIPFMGLAMGDVARLLLKISRKAQSSSVVMESVLNPIMDPIQQTRARRLLEEVKTLQELSLIDPTHPWGDFFDSSFQSNVMVSHETMLNSAAAVHLSKTDFLIFELLHTKAAELDTLLVILEKFKQLRQLSVPDTDVTVADIVSSSLNQTDPAKLPYFHLLPIKGNRPASS
jgi:hypothetical protein